jgi:hypothetical protein
MQKHEEKYVKILIYIPEKLHSELLHRIQQKMIKGIDNFSQLVVLALKTFTGEQGKSK